MRLSHRRKKANKNGIPQRQYAARQARKLLQHQRRLRGFARRQHRKFAAILRPVARKVAITTLLNTLCFSHGACFVAAPALCRPDSSEVKITRLALGIQLAAMTVKPAPASPSEPETKPSVWQRVKAKVSGWFERTKMTENVQL